MTTADFERVAAEAEQQLLWIVGVAWQHGWQPSELLRYARQRDRRLVPALAALVVVDRDRHEPARVHPRWSAQVDAVGVPSPPAVGWLLDAIEPEALDGRDRLTLVVSLLVLLTTIPSLPMILPPPGDDPSTWRRHDEHRAPDDPFLAKVRALLSQAESTPFEAEADAFTAKAQELMARHSIDEAMVWSRSGREGGPASIRLPLDDPYASQKADLLHVVASHARCKAVRHAGIGLVSVVGFAADLAATEVLFTSLLVQSQAAMRAEAANSPPGSHTRGRSFRSSFLSAYACRIDKRLAEVNAAVEAEVSDQDVATGGGSRLLPVLAARSDAVDEQVAAMFGELRRVGGRRSYDRFGWDRGVLAADRARLRPDLPPPSESV